MVGVVKEVFIPQEYNNGILIDIMDSNKIGFIVQIENQEIKIIQKQSKENSNIFKKDKVIITKNVEEEYDIKLFNEV